MISKNRLVAIVDDEADITKLFRDALGVVSGITIFTFTDPIIALEHIMINKTKYVLIISDLRMPGLNGMELIKKVKNMNRLVRTVLMTAFDFDDELFQQYIETQIINGFLQKPIMLKDLVKEVDNQLHIYQLQGQKTRVQ